METNNEIWYKAFEFEKPRSGQRIKLLKGDTFYVSTKGRIKLNDKILSLGDGLALTADGNLRVCGIHIFGKYKRIYTFIYCMARNNGDLFDNYEYQIHHIDKDHTNNDIDNLQLVTVSEHGKIHGQEHGEFEQYYIEQKKYFKLESLKYNEYLDKWKSYCQQRYDDYINSDEYQQILLEKKQEHDRIIKERAEERRRKSEQRKAQREQEKLLDEEQKLSQGTHFRCKNGRLMSYAQIHNMHAKPHDRSYVTDEWKKKQSDNAKQMYKDGKITGKCKTEQKEKERREKLKERWKDPEYRDKVIKHVKETMKDPEYRDKVSKRVKELWNDPEYRDKISKRRKESFNDPEKHEKRKARAKKGWKTRRANILKTNKLSDNKTT